MTLALKIKRPEPVVAGFRPDCRLMTAVSFNRTTVFSFDAGRINRPGSYAALQSGLDDAVYATLSLQSDEYVHG